MKLGDQFEVKGNEAHILHTQGKMKWRVKWRVRICIWTGQWLAAQHHQPSGKHKSQYGWETVPFPSLTIMKNSKEGKKEGREKRERERKEGGREGGGRKKEIGRKERRRKEKRNKGRKEGEREKKKKKEVGKDVEKSEPPMHSWLLAGLQCRPWKSRREAVPLPRGLHGTSATSRGQVLSPSSHNGQAILQWVETILRNS